MALAKLLKSLHGRAFGLGPNNELIVNQEGVGGDVNAQALVCNRVRRQLTQAEVQGLNTSPVSLVFGSSDYTAVPVFCTIARAPGGVAFATGATVHLGSSLAPTTIKLSADHAPNAAILNTLGGVEILSLTGSQYLDAGRGISLSSNADFTAGDDVVRCVVDLWWLAYPRTPAT